MSTKMNKLVLLSALMIAIIGTFGTVSAEETVDLIAGNGNGNSNGNGNGNGNSISNGEGIDVGDVTVTNNATHIVVEFTTTGGWLLNETHLHVANESEYIPQTKKGNPQPGQFDYSVEHDCITTITYVVPLIDIEISDEGTVCIAAHAAVELPPESEEGEIRYESAWGNGYDFEGKNWAMYFTYTIPSTTETTPVSDNV